MTEPTAILKYLTSLHFSFWPSAGGSAPLSPRRATGEVPRGSNIGGNQRRILWRQFGQYGLSSSLLDWSPSGFKVDAQSNRWAFIESELQCPLCVGDGHSHRSATSIPFNAGP